MTDKIERKGISPIAAGITGLILGVLGTTTIALSDLETRKKAGKKASEMSDSVKKWSEDTLKQYKEKTREIQAKAEDAKRRALQSTKDLVEDDQSERMDETRLVH
jgi:hypothetical protein